MKNVEVETCVVITVFASITLIIPPQIYLWHCVMHHRVREMMYHDPEILDN